MNDYKVYVEGVFIGNVTEVREAQGVVTLHVMRLPQLGKCYNYKVYDKTGYAVGGGSSICR